MMYMAIFGIELLNEGSGISIDDISNESQITFVARDIKPWQPLTTAGDWAKLSSGAATIGAKVTSDINTLTDNLRRQADTTLNQVRSDDALNSL